MLGNDTDHPAVLNDQLSDDGRQTQLEPAIHQGSTKASDEGIARGQSGITTPPIAGRQVKARDQQALDQYT